MGVNNVTGDSISTKYGSKEAQKNFENNFDKIFGKKDVLCSICGKDTKTTKECAWTGCPLNWDEERIDRIGANGDGFPLENHYEK
jgi:hypothetical protein